MNTSIRDVLVSIERLSGDGRRSANLPVINRLANEALIKIYGGERQYAERHAPPAPGGEGT